MPQKTEENIQTMLLKKHTAKVT